MLIGRWALPPEAIGSWLEVIRACPLPLMSDECVCRSLCLVCSLFVSRSLYFFACSHCLFIPLNVPFGNLTVKWSNNRRGSTSDAKCTGGLIAQRFSIHPNVSHPQFSTFLQLLTVSSIDTNPSDEILSASRVRRNPHKYHFSESSSENTAPHDCTASSFLISCYLFLFMVADVSVRWKTANAVL